MLPQARPAFIDMYIHPCHRRCRHCFAAQSPAVGGLMDAARFRRYTSRIQDAASGPAPLFKSWELVPFADALHHPDVLQLVAQMESLGNPSLRVLSSDCWRVAHDPDWEPLLDNLRENHVWGFQLTLYGMENTHDWFAGKKGSFAAIELATERLLAKGFQVAWVIILHEKNAAELEEMLRWIAARTPNAAIDMIPFTFSGSGEKHAADAISPRSFARLTPEVRARIRQDLRTEREWQQLAAEGTFPVPPRWDRLSRTINLQIFHDGAVAGGIEGCIPLGHMENDSLADLVNRHDRLLLPYYQEQKRSEQELLAWVAAQKQLGAEDILSTASNQLKLWKRKRDLPPDWVGNRRMKAACRIHPQSREALSNHPINSVVYVTKGIAMFWRLLAVYLIEAFCIGAFTYTGVHWGRENPEFGGWFSVVSTIAAALAVAYGRYLSLDVPKLAHIISWIIVMAIAAETTAYKVRRNNTAL